MMHASPLRYPGGKAKLTPFFKRLLELNNLCDGHYAEAYAGGSGLALSLMYAEYVRYIHINDIDRAVYAFWHSVLNRTDDLCRLIERRPLNPDEWRRQRRIVESKNDADLFELGFAAFYLNRTSRSGIIASGGMIGGNKQRGRWKLDARFNRAALVERVRRVASYRCRITLTHLDAIDFLGTMAIELPDSSLTYLDPPYFVKGQRRLYADFYKAGDHGEVADTLAAFPHRWVVSYDYAPEILTLYQDYGCFVYDLRYSAQDRYDGAETMFFSPDLSLPPLSLLDRLGSGHSSGLTGAR
ncbi:MAG: DNA adenine methylase [Gemmatimonadetes bacterium]|nr:DNA adenine methylase [Gemmatimonadota bacterium]